MEFNRARLKRDVKLSMKGTTPNPMLVTLLFTVAVSVGTGLLNGVLGFFLTGNAGSLSDMVINNIQRGYEVEEALERAMLELLSMGPGAIFSMVVGGAVLSIIVSLWRSTMNVGYSGWCLSMVRRESPPMGEIFCAFPQIGPVLATRILTGVFEFLWVLLLSVGYAVVMFGLTFVAVTLEFVPLLLLVVWVVTVAYALGVTLITLRYALVNYVLLDKGLSGLDAIRESKRLMKGRTKDAFFLQLSFLGWYLLECAIVIVSLLIAVVAFGGPFLIDYINAEMFAAAVLSFFAIMLLAVIAVFVLNLWLQPYVTGAMAAFYDWARGAADGFAAGPRFDVGPGGWGGPTDYTWTSGPTSGTGTGAGPGNGDDSDRPPWDDPWN